MIRRFLIVLLALAMAGCSSITGTGDTNYPIGDGDFVQIPVDDREAPVEISGVTLDGDPIDLADFRGEVVVLNLWGSWCTPCRAEAPRLQEASENLDAQFVGMSFRESSFENARNHDREFAITYPTIADEGDGILALGRFRPIAPPTTYVLDEQGRVAALISGELKGVGSLEDIVNETAAESSDSSESSGEDPAP